MSTHTKVDIGFEQRLARARASAHPSRLYVKLLLRILSIFRDPFRLAGFFLLTGVTLLLIDYEQTKSTSASYTEHVVRSLDRPLRSPRAPAPRPREAESVRPALSHATQLGTCAVFCVCYACRPRVQWVSWRRICFSLYSQ